MQSRWPEMAGNYTGFKGNVGIIASRFNESIVEQLIAGALEAFQRCQIVDVEIFRVPGAFEIPLVSQRLAQTGRYAGLLALGAVIKGDTPHFDFVASSCTSGLSDVQLKTGVPIGFGVLTTDTMEQARDRSGGKAGNKGADCAMSLIETMSLLGKINE